MEELNNSGEGIKARRWKSGLETPLVGRYSREKWLIFAPPLWYDVLVGCCILFGPLTILLQWLFAPYVSFDGWFGFKVLGGAVTIAGVWAVLSQERLVCNLQKKTYVRLEGARLGRRITRGSLSEFDAIVLMTQDYPWTSFGGRTVIYRSVLFWRAQRQPLMVLEHEQCSLAQHYPLNYGVAGIYSRAHRYADTLGVRLIDQSAVLSQAPLPLL